MPEFFPTPLEVTFELFKLGVLHGCTSLLDPCAGDGAIVKAARKCRWDWYITAIEIDDFQEPHLQASGADRVIIGDCLKQRDIGTFDCVIVNPPYSNIEAMIWKGFEHLNIGGKMACLLRLAHLTGIQRGYFLEELKPSSVHFLCNRPTFAGNATDIGGYAWVIWDNPITKVDTTCHWIQRNPHKVDGRINNGAKRKKIFADQDNFRSPSAGFQSRPRGPAKC